MTIIKDSNFFLIQHFSEYYNFIINFDSFVIWDINAFYEII